MDTNLSLSDIASVVKDNDHNFLGGDSGTLIILFLLICMMGNGNLFGNNNGAAAATANDIQRAVDLNSIQQGQTDISSDIQRGIYEINGSTKDAAYNNLSEIRDVQAAVATNGANIINTLTAMQANQQNCCCETKSTILENRYLAAQNAAATQAAIAQQSATLATAIHAEGEQTRAMMQQDKIESLQSQINSLQLQNAVSGVVRYPMASTYSSGANPFCGCSGTSY